MNILVVNDDGIGAPGILALVDALSHIADVYVCAPDGQRSAKSHSITLSERVQIRKVDFPGAEGAYVTSGTPADCTKIGLQFFEEEGIKIDMVYSGINMGSNLGKDTLYSGTVGAAAEGVFENRHSVAVSVGSHNARDFRVAQDLAVAAADKIYGKIPTSVLININVPDVPPEEIMGVRVVPLGDRYFNDGFKCVEGDGYELGGAPYSQELYCRNSDMEAFAQNYATITPLKFDLTDYAYMEKIKGWRF